MSPYFLIQDSLKRGESTPIVSHLWNQHADHVEQLKVAHEAEINQLQSACKSHIEHMASMHSEELAHVFNQMIQARQEAEASFLVKQDTEAHLKEVLHMSGMVPPPHLHLESEQTSQTNDELVPMAVAKAVQVFPIFFLTDHLG